MYKAKVQGIEKVFDCDDVFDAIYVRFLRSPKVEIFKDKTRTETLTEDEFAKLKKLLSERCPRKEKCQRCFIDVDCPLLIGWEKKGDVFEHSYPLLGEYFPEEKKVVLYVNDDDCKGQHTYKGVLSTYIHELFHAYFHYVTEQKQAKYNYIREIEEAMTEFSTLVFLRMMKNEYSYEWCDIYEWAVNEIGKKQNTVGNLSAYGFGRYLFDNVPEKKAFNWINKYAERLGYIDEEDELVKQYKQMVYPYYPTEPDKCLELLRKILFETNNKPIKPRDVKANRVSSMLNIEEEYKDMLDRLWESAKDGKLKEVVKRNYAIEKEIPQNALLFVSMNPSCNKGDERGGGFVDVNKAQHPFFTAIRDFYKSIIVKRKPLMAHYDLLFIRETNQKTVLSWEKDEDNKDFFEKQESISKEIIKKAEPKIIVVLNAGARELFKKLFGDNAPFCDSLGTYMYKLNENDKGTPVLFSGMLSGRRSLDNGSKESLKWHIEHILKNYPD